MVDTTLKFSISSSIFWWLIFCAASHFEESLDRFSFNYWIRAPSCPHSQSQYLSSSVCNWYVSLLAEKNSRQINFLKMKPKKKNHVWFRHPQQALEHFWKCWVNRSSCWTFNPLFPIYYFHSRNSLLLKCSRWYLFTSKCCISHRHRHQTNYYCSVHHDTIPYIFEWIAVDCATMSVIYLINFNQFYWCLEFGNSAHTGTRMPILNTWFLDVNIL